MARPRSDSDPRFDFRGGVNTSFSEDTVDASELRRIKNGRLGSTYGAIDKRPGSQRVHDAAIGAGAQILGLFQWDAPTGKQLVAVANGNLYHKLAAATDFTAIAAALSTTRRVSWAPYRIGAGIKLVFADGALRQFDGAALTSAIANAPAARRVALYKGRLFATDGTKRLYATRVGVGDPPDFLVANGGVFADVETYDSEPLTGILVVGSSLLLFKEDNIARYTGISQSDIQIDTESEGVSSEIGLLAEDTLIRVEEIGFGLTTAGPYLFTEAGIEPLAFKLEKEFDLANKAQWQNAVAGYHRGRREVWLSIPPSGQAQNTVTWILNLRTKSWSGPHVFGGFNPAIYARYELADASENLVIGGYDGFVRQADVPAVLAVDDVTRAGSGGTPIEWDGQFAAMTFGAPGRVKSMKCEQHVEADLGAAGVLVPYWSSEMGSGEGPALNSLGPGVKDYYFKLFAKGKRIVVGFRESTSTLISFVGFDPRAIIGGKK
jgi:hypothetical protein